jgi:hypothetical protein
MKPKVGDIVSITDEHLREFVGSGSDDCEVFAVFDHYEFDKPGGNWDPYGELAMAQADADDENGKKGEWYVIVSWKQDQGTTMSLASYECKVIVCGICGAEDDRQRCNEFQMTGECTVETR